ncbi:MAG: hypothetical protein IKB75_06085 [Clostridia bacterium]|nr:hypothetical protein [Clostridia bacterium]
MEKAAFTDLIGNDSVKETLKNRILSSRLSHAYLLEAPQGQGKHMLALRIAMALACEHKDDASLPLPCMRCPACKKILGGNSPDVIYVKREKDKATFGVGPIREMRADVAIAPFELSKKVYILEEAHLMTDQAQNALLLTLEEPPSYALFLLLCDRIEPMLETIRSRAPVLRLLPVPTDRMREHLLSTSGDAKELEARSPQEMRELIAAADGSIGRALALLDERRRKPILAQRRLTRQMIELYAQRHQTVAALKLLKSFPEKREDLIAQLRVTLTALRDLLICKQSDVAPLCFFFEREEAMELAYPFTTAELLALTDRMILCIDELSRNANVRLALTALAQDTGLLT